MIIDAHAHISPPGADGRFPMPPSLRDIPGMIEAKLALGVQLSIVGSPVGAGVMAPVPGVDNYAQSAARLREFHEWLAGAVAAYPDNLRALVYVNPLGDDEHLQSAADTLRDPAFVGFIVNTSVAGRYLDDRRCDSFFALAAENDAPVMLHAPAWPAAGTGLTDPHLIEQVGRADDVSTGVACIIFAGWLDKYPGLRLIATAGGGALALLGERLDLAHEARHWHGNRGAAAAPLSRAPSSYLRDIWVDTATPSRLALGNAAAVFGPGKMLFGTDYPPMEGAVTAGLNALAGLPLTDGQRRAVHTTNAARLFRLSLVDARS